MSAFTTVRENTMTAEERFQLAVQQKNRRAKNIDGLNIRAVQESSQVLEMEELEKMDKTCDEKEKKIKELEELKETANAKRRKAGKILLEQRLEEEGKKSVFEMVLFEMVFNAYVADEDFKESSMDKMFESFQTEFTVLESTCRKADDSKLVKEMKLVIEAACKKAAKRIVSENNTEDPQLIEFNLTDEEEEDLDKNLSELGVDQIEQLVKAKVVQVVKDEKEQNIKKAKVIQEIDDELATVTDGKEEEELSVEESFKVRTLTTKKNRFNASFSSSLFDSIMMETSLILESAIVEEGALEVSPKQKMDATLVESILKYTVLEVAHTLQLFEFDKYTVETLVNDFTFKK